jgi:hypothetical protein
MAVAAFVPGLDVVDGLAVGLEGLDAAVTTAETIDEGVTAARAVDETATESSGLAEDLSCVVPQSFTGDTEVRLADGTSKPIDQVHIGDQVETTDPASGKTSGQTVTDVSVHHDTDLMDVTVQTGGVRSVLHTTEHHPFWDDTTHTWTDADQLHPGDHLHTDTATTASTTTTVVATAILPGSGTRWDLTVNHTHDFYVLTTGTSILVHNAGPCGPIKGAVGESRAIQELQGRGYTIMGKHVMLEASDGTTSYVDVVATKDGLSYGAPEFFEVKNGPNAALSPQQKVVYGQLGDRGGVILRSDQMSAWGLQSGDLLSGDVNIMLYGGARAW